MSLYSSYLKERTEDNIIETNAGFITYRYINPSQVYVVDIYVLPEFRNKGIASLLADQVAEEAKAKGCSEMLGTVVPSCKGSTQSIQVLLAYGMKLDSCTNNLIVCKKDI